MEVCVVSVVVVCVVVDVEPGVDWLGEVDEGAVCELASGVAGCDVLGVLGVVCATAHTADSNRIAVIRYTFLIGFLLNTSGRA